MDERNDLHAENTATSEGLTALLEQSPEHIKRFQEAADLIRRRYARKFSEVAIEALSMALFPGKTPEDPQRPAGNEKEREMAIKYATTHDQTLSQYAADLDRVKRQLAAAKNADKNLRMIARLFITEE